MIKNLNPFIEIIKPRIVFLVIVTTYLGYYLGLRSINSHMLLFSEWIMFFHLVFGTFLTGASACALNQTLEYKYDKKMDRTKDRPVPNGKISFSTGLFYSISIGIFGVAYLYVFTNIYTSLLSLITILFYILVYTPLKRYTVYNTIIGAIPGALPPVGGWFAATNEISLTLFLIFCILFTWQIPHFLSLAYIYSEDYERGGFKMLPNIYSDTLHTKAHILFFSFCMFSVTIGLYLNNTVGIIYLLGSSILGLISLYFMLIFLINDSIKNARNLFITTIIYLPVILILTIINS